MNINNGKKKNNKLNLKKAKKLMYKILKIYGVSQL